MRLFVKDRKFYAALASLTAVIALQNLITFGILFGTFIGSLGTIVVTNAPNADLLKQYYLWGAANFNLEGVTSGDIIFSSLRGVAP